MVNEEAVNDMLAEIIIIKSKIDTVIMLLQDYPENYLNEKRRKYINILIADKKDIEQLLLAEYEAIDISEVSKAINVS